MTIVVTGGSGFVGTALTRALLAKGHTVIIIDAVGPSLTHEHLFYIPCDLAEHTLPFNVLERTDAVIHLAGKNLFTKWTEKAKQELWNSRIRSTTHVVESISGTQSKPPIFISASAVGFYGECGDSPVDESAPKGSTFLADLADAWEKEAQKATALGSRVVIVRTAPVVGRGGMLGPLLRLARFHLTGRLSKHDFWMPWIHMDDLIRIYLFALETGTLQGVVNAASPAPIRHHEFIRALGKETKSLSLGRLPFIKSLFGKLAEELSVNQIVIPKRLIDKGFEFAFTDIGSALRHTIHEAKR